VKEVVKENVGKIRKKGGVVKIKDKV